MTITEPTAGADLSLVTVDLYRDIHKGIRAELFALTEEAGRVDPSAREDRACLAAHVRSTVALLVSHAEHEDTHMQPAIEEHLATLAAQIAHEHEILEGRLQVLQSLADDAVDADEATARMAAHRLYLDLASFTSAYLAHQDLEERAVMPALEVAIGPQAALVIHQAIVTSIPPEEMVQSLALMLPAMNVDDRTELLGGMQAGAPPEVFNGVWSLAGSVLAPVDHAALARRLGIAS